VAVVDVRVLVVEDADAYLQSHAIRFVRVTKMGLDSGLDYLGGWGRIGHRRSGRRRSRRGRRRRRRRCRGVGQTRAPGWLLAEKVQSTKDSVVAAHPAMSGCRLWPVAHPRAAGSRAVPVVTAHAASMGPSRLRREGILLLGTTIRVPKKPGKTHFLSQKTEHKRT
jgi:hypothetical protein